MNEGIKHVTDRTFDSEVLASPVPVLVDYWAQWCAPCKLIAPLLEEWAQNHGGQLKVAKIDIDDNPEVPSRYHVRSVPTLMLFREGRPVATQVGALGKAQLAAFIDRHV